MAITQQTMSEEQRKSVALEYLKRLDRGENFFDLFSDDAQVFYPKWGLANGKGEIERLFSDAATFLKAIRHDYAYFNYIIREITWWWKEPVRERSPMVANGKQVAGAMSSRFAISEFSASLSTWTLTTPVPIPLAIHGTIKGADKRAFLPFVRKVLDLWRLSHRQVKTRSERSEMIL